MSQISWLLEVQIQDGQAENYKPLAEDLVASTKNETGALVYECTKNADGNVCHFYERYKDSAAAVIHLGNFGANFAGRFMEVLTPLRFTVYGTPSDELKGALAAFDPTYMDSVDGFSR